MAKAKARKKKITWKKAIEEAVKETYPVLVKLREYDLKRENK
jgi:hypothetical protein